MNTSFATRVAGTLACTITLAALGHTALGQGMRSPASYSSLAAEMKEVLAKPESIARTNQVLQSLGMRAITETTIEKSGVSASDTAMLGITVQLLDDLIADGAVVYTSTITAVGAIQMQNVTIPWGQKKLRDDYDGFKKQADIWGPLLLAVGTVLDGDGNRSSSAICAGIGGLLLIGAPAAKMANPSWTSSGDQAQTKAKEVSAALQHLDLSRRAYDDVKLQLPMYEAYSKKAQQRLAALKPLRDACDEMLRRISKGEQVDETELRGVVDNVMATVNEYELLSSFFGDFVAQMSGRLGHYWNDYPDLRDMLGEAKKEVEGLNQKFQDTVGKPFLSEVPALKAELRDWLTRPSEVSRVLPSTASLAQGEKKAFSVTGASLDEDVLSHLVWTIGGGTFTTHGLSVDYTAGSVPGVYGLSVADSRQPDRSLGSAIIKIR